MSTRKTGLSKFLSTLRTGRPTAGRMLALYAIVVLLLCIGSACLMFYQSARRLQAAEECAANMKAVRQLENDFVLRNGHYATLEELQRAHPAAAIKQRCPLDGSPYRLSISDNNGDCRLTMECLHGAAHARLSDKPEDYDMYLYAMVCGLL